MASYLVPSGCVITMSRSPQEAFPRLYDPPHTMTTYRQIQPTYKYQATHQKRRARLILLKNGSLNVTLIHIHSSKRSYLNKELEKAYVQFGSIKSSIQQQCHASVNMQNQFFFASHGSQFKHYYMLTPGKTFSPTFCRRCSISSAY